MLTGGSWQLMPSHVESSRARLAVLSPNQSLLSTDAGTRIGSVGHRQIDLAALDAMLLSLGETAARLQQFDVVGIFSAENTAVAALAAHLAQRTSPSGSATRVPGSAHAQSLLPLPARMREDVWRRSVAKCGCNWKARMSRPSFSKMRGKVTLQ